MRRSLFLGCFVVCMVGAIVEGAVGTGTGGAVAFFFSGACVGFMVDAIGAIVGGTVDTGGSVVGGIVGDIAGAMVEFVGAAALAEDIPANKTTAMRRRRVALIVAIFFELGGRKRNYSNNSIE
jgi:hypothetical protein